MKSPKNEDLCALLDAYLDGALPPDLESRVRTWLVSEPNAMGILEKDLELGAALQQMFRATPEGDRVALKGPGTAGSAWRGRWVAGLAAACVVAAFVGFLGGRLTGTPEGDLPAPGDRSSSAEQLVSTMDIVKGRDAVLLAVTGRPDAVRLVRGSVQVMATSDLRKVVALDSAEVEISGDVALYQAPAPVDGGEPHALVTVRGGQALVRLVGENEPVVVHPGTTAVVLRDDVIFMDQVLAPYRKQAIPIVPFSDEEQEEANKAQDQVPDLLAQIQVLKLQLAASRRGGRPRLTVQELFKSVTERLEGQDLSQEKTWRRYGHMRALMHLFRKARGKRGQGNPDAADIAFLKGVLTNESSSSAERMLAIRVLGGVCNDGVCAVVQPFVSSKDAALRRAAVDTLSRRSDPAQRDLLREIFQRTEEEMDIRVLAAGGLVQRGDYGDPLSWMMNAWRSAPEGSSLRRLTLSKVVSAPVDRISDFLIEAAAAPDVRSRSMDWMVRLLGNMGGAEAERVLEAMASTFKDERLRARASRALARLRGQD